MTIKYGLHFFFFELTDNDGQNFLAGIVLWRPKNFGRHFLDIQIKCKYIFRNRNPTSDSCHFDNQFKLFEAQIFQKSDMNEQN
jgi:hypothetical protein